ncbi:hypothetical protein PC123_g14673 [Phytophthora cactorum]|nr:hypothetical protein PC123_g14673 [Phytophthora cactorum]
MACTGSTPSSSRCVTGACDSALRDVDDPQLDGPRRHPPIASVSSTARLPVSLLGAVPSSLPPVRVPQRPTPSWLQPALRLGSLLTLVTMPLPGYLSFRQLHRGAILVSMSFTRVSCRFTVVSRHCITFINVAAASGVPDSPTLLPTSPFDAVVIVGCTDTVVPVLVVGPAPVAEARVVTSVEYSMLPQELGPQRPPVIVLSLQELGPQNSPRLSQSSKAVPKVLPHYRTRYWYHR